MVNLSVKTGHQNVSMLGIGAYRPRRLVSNDEVCQVLDSSDEWIFERSGIRNRRWISGDESARSMAAAAAERAIANSGVAKEKIGALILATNSWKTKIPHGGPIVASDIGLNGIPAYDVAAGCGGFGYGLGVAADTDTVLASVKAYVGALNRLKVRREKTAPDSDTKSVSMYSH